MSLSGGPSHVIVISGSVERKVLSKDIKDIQVQKGIIWSSLAITSKSGAIKLDGLSPEGAKAVRKAIIRDINSWASSIISAELKEIGLFDKIVRKLIANQSQYLAKADIKKAVSQVGGQCALALTHPFFSVNLQGESVRKALPSSLEFLTNSSKREQYNNAFLSAELARYKGFFDSVLENPLTGEQREACIRLEDSNLLVAAAGSGKTATIVSKLLYLLQKGLYEPHEILVLAFNNDAAGELRHRISDLLCVDEDELQVKVSTFHALGRNIIESASGSAPRIANWVKHPAGRTKVMDKLIEELLVKDFEFARLWKDLLVYYPKADIPVQSFSSNNDYQRFIEDRRFNGSATVMTLSGGLFVRSLQEQRIANWLWEHQVDFIYEKVLTGLTDENGMSFTATPDFFYTKTHTYHEHLAIKSNGSSPFDGYLDKTESKRLAYKKLGIDYFETTSADAEKDKLTEKLEKELVGRGIPLRKRPVSEVLEAVSPVIKRRYHVLLETCIQHVRASKLTADMLNRRVGALYDKSRAKKFIALLIKVTDAYERRLKDENTIDFDSMISDATGHIVSGRYKSPFSLILVDEFQDISPSRALFIQALKNQLPFTKLFAVGDDWQSIYRFAGSDITLLTDFDGAFGDSWIGRLQSTFRSNQTIATAAADFIKKNPQQIDKTISSIRGPVKYSIRAIPVDFSVGNNSVITDCDRLLERINTRIALRASKERSSQAEKFRVLILGRYRNLVPQGIELVRSHLVAEFMTFHKAKGLEADYVILLDVSEGAYGVPSQVEDDELLNLVIPSPETFPYAEERRLFYVALTRASRGVFILFNKNRPSRYIGELSQIAPGSIKYESVEGNQIFFCSKCSEGMMLRRKANRDGAEFLGCSNYPYCKSTMPVQV